MALNESVVEPAEAAESAGLVHVHDQQPGIRRKKAGAGFAYFGSDGERIQDDKTLQRIRKLAISPAWKDVWITASQRRLQCTLKDKLSESLEVLQRQASAPQRKNKPKRLAAAAT